MNALFCIAFLKRPVSEVYGTRFLLLFDNFWLYLVKYTSKPRNTRLPQASNKTISDTFHLKCSLWLAQIDSLRTLNDLLKSFNWWKTKQLKGLLSLASILQFATWWHSWFLIGLQEFEALQQISRFCHISKCFNNVHLVNILVIKAFKDVLVLLQALLNSLDYALNINEIILIQL